MKRGSVVGGERDEKESIAWRERYEKKECWLESKRCKESNLDGEKDMKRGSVGWR